MSQIDVFLELLGLFLTGALSYLLLEASKYVGKFDWKVFYKTNIKPMSWTALGSLLILVVYSFVPKVMPFIEVQSGKVDISSYEGIILSGTVIGGLIKNFFSGTKINSPCNFKLNP